MKMKRLLMSSRVVAGLIVVLLVPLPALAQSPTSTSGDTIDVRGEEVPIEFLPEIRVGEQEGQVEEASESGTEPAASAVRERPGAPGPEVAEADSQEADSQVGANGADSSATSAMSGRCRSETSWDGAFLNMGTLARPNRHSAPVIPVFVHRSGGSLARRHPVPGDPRACGQPAPRSPVRSDQDAD